MKDIAGALSGQASPSALPEPVARIQQLAAQVSARRPVEPQQLFLPGFEEWMKAMPNHLARSSLFAPVARGKKAFHIETRLISRSDAVITYTGMQLDETQADVWMQLIADAKDAPLGVPIAFSRSGFLRRLGRNASGPNYKWLHSAMKTLTAATIIIEARNRDGRSKYRLGDTRALHLLTGFDYDSATERYTFTIDPRWKTLFGFREYALIDWNKRLQISQGQDVAKALQRLVATSSDQVQRYALSWLKEMLQYNGRLRDFKSSLQKAMTELERVGIIVAGRIEHSSRGVEQAVWQRPPDTS